MKYKIYGTGVVDTADGSIIPNTETNPDWVIYLAWVAEGNTPDPEFTDPEIDARRIAEIKKTAGTKIVEIMPEWKQRNNLARVLELLAMVTDVTGLPTEDQTELADALAEWDNLKAIRTASDIAETNGDNPDDIVWPI